MPWTCFPSYCSRSPPPGRILGLDRPSPHGFTAAARSDRHARASRRQGHNGGVNVELLVVAKCPHEREALDLLHEVLTAAGLAQVDVHTIVIRTQSDAVTQGFVGSPTSAPCSLAPVAPRPPFAIVAAGE